MTDPESSAVLRAKADALTIARWCWPDRAWMSAGDTERILAAGPSYICDVAAAEAVVIERGLASEYGEALVDLILTNDDRDGYDGYNSDAYAKLATAPPSARIKALAAVIRAQEARKV